MGGTAGSAQRGAIALALRLALLARPEQRYAAACRIPEQPGLAVDAQFVPRRVHVRRLDGVDGRM